MIYESVQKAAERLGVSPRAVQKRAAQGKIPGAVKEGRDWRIPVSDISTAESSDTAEKKSVPEAYRTTMHLLDSTHAPGDCLKHIYKIDDKDDRNVALGQYYFFSGESQKAVEILEPYLGSSDVALKYSASFFSMFSYVTTGQLHLAKYAMNSLYDQVKAGLHPLAPPELKAVCVFTGTACSVMFHLPTPPLPPLEEHVKYLNGGIKYWACYVLAHKAYNEKNYERCVAIADIALAMQSKQYVITSIYLHIVAAMGLINLKRVEDAKKHIMDAWSIAEPDNIVCPFGEHHPLLQGLIEVCFKKERPEEYDKMISIAQSFRSNWSKMGADSYDSEAANQLTATEFTVAMLYNRNWSAQEIAAHMNLSEHTVRGYIKNIYAKLSIKDKNGLKKYMIN
ncbi:MAG: helix-turn-helix domain-containing protein [Clostridia bacterium]|nr:helix-turn-helix domain-containing protein [Clostridia bacterium]